MRYILGLTLLLIMSSCLTKTSQPFTSSSNYFKGIYSSFLESDELEINSWYHYVTSTNKKGEYKVRIFYPEKKQITSLETYSSKSAKVRNGIAVKWSDNGIKTSEGYFVDDKKKGSWKYYHRNNGILSSEGDYKNGRENGKWKYYDGKGRIKTELNYLNGIKEGEFIEYDTLSNIINRGVYKSGEIIKESNKKEEIKLVEEMPYLSSCKGIVDKDERKKCSERTLLQYVSNNIKYPVIAREYGVEGIAVIKFYIDEDGSINHEEIEVLKGICQSISDECLRIVKQMPKWEAGKQDGKNVKVYFNLPIRFKLN